MNRTEANLSVLAVDICISTWNQAFRFRDRTCAAQASFFHTLASRTTNGLEVFTNRVRTYQYPRCLRPRERTAPQRFRVDRPPSSRHIHNLGGAHFDSTDDDTSECTMAANFESNSPIVAGQCSYTKSRDEKIA
jgi:hypothetical protein